MIHTSSYTVNISPNRGYTIVDLNQNENGRKLVFILVDDEAINIPSGTTAVITGTKPDGVVFSAEGAVDTEARQATFIEYEQMTVVAGKWEAKLKLIYAGETIATSRILFRVDADIIEEGAIPSDSETEGILAEMRHYLEEVKAEVYGAPLIAEVSTDMIDRNRVYVYIGNEEGYEPGYWYYWNGDAWTIGGSYNAIDETLSQVGKAADAKATGEALDTKVDKIEGKGLSTEDFTTEEKNKLSQIEAGSTRVLVDAEVSDTSTNPVQNKVIKEYIDANNVTDKTLSVADKSADAKATGDAIENEKLERITAVSAEEQARKAQVVEKATELQAAIDAEAENRRRAVTDEASLRKAADDLEIQNRTNAIQQEANERAAAITFLQSQIDEHITAHFYEVDPTNAAKPSSDWDTSDKKNSHLGDLYYNTLTGKLWRWRVSGGVYTWQEIVNSDLTKALSDAAGAIEAVNQMNAKVNRKADKSEVPTKTSDLTNDSDFVTKEYVDEHTAESITTDTTLTVSGAAADSKTVGDELKKKVNAVTGKGLSTNDFTQVEREKLAGISANATRVIVDYAMNDSSSNPVQSRVIKAYVDDKVSDLQTQINQIDPTGEIDPAQIQDLIDAATANKVDKVSGKGLSTEDYTTAEKNKLAGIEAGAEANVNADWNAASGDAAILNKPTIPSKVSDLTNDLNFIKESEVSEIQPSEIDDMLENAGTSLLEILSDFVTTGTLNIHIAKSLLTKEEIEDTVQSIAFDQSGNVQRITHTRNNSAVRTDVFTFGTGTITEVRTLSTGENLTIVTNTTTLETTVTYAVA